MHPRSVPTGGEGMDIKGKKALNKFAKAIADKSIVCGIKTEIFTRLGWRLPKRSNKALRGNPAAIMRDLMIRAGKYPIDPVERAGWDKTLGELYKYAEGKVDGFVMDERIKLRGV